jgi:phage repressor protein C with HTH and peptisase S24 domain
MAKKTKTVSPLGKKIQALIRAANFDYIKEFERVAGVRPDSIRRLIGGYTKSLPAPELSKVAATLKMSVEEILSDSDGENILLSNIVPEAKDPRWHKIRSDEMAPTLPLGSYVVVDTGAKEYVAAGVYLIGTPSASAFRRVSFDPIAGIYHIDVDNKNYNYAQDIKAEDLKIEGRVLGIFCNI